MDSMKVLSMLLTLRQAQRPFWVAAALGASMLTLPAHATRIKEVAAIQGVRSNQLTGYGLVVGLDGTGVREAPKRSHRAGSSMASPGRMAPERSSSSSDCRIRSCRLDVAGVFSNGCLAGSIF